MLLLLKTSRILTLPCYICIGPKWFRCSLIGDVNFARTLTTSEKILSIFFFLNLESHACRRKKHKPATLQSSIQKGNSCSHNLCVYIPHILLGGQSESKAAPLCEL